MPSKLATALAGLLIMLSCNGLQAAPRLIVSIHPLYLLTSQIAGENADVQRLIPPGLSPHDYRLRPSQRLALANADAIFWLGPQLETGLAGLLNGGAIEVPVHALAVSHQVVDGNAAGSRADPGAQVATHGHQHASGAEREAVEHAQDAHDWLDPVAAARMAMQIAEILVRLDPAAAPDYQARAEQLAVSLTALERESRVLLAPMHSRRYWVAHDAYGQFEARFGLRHSGVVAVSPEQLPGAAHIVSLQRQLESNSVDCVFREPQFHPPILARLLETRRVPVIKLDPLASEYRAGPGSFLAFMRDFVLRFASCGGAG